jgi:hypothetical protein
MTIATAMLMLTVPTTVALAIAIDVMAVVAWLSGRLEGVRIRVLAGRNPAAEFEVYSEVVMQCSRSEDGRGFRSGGVRLGSQKGNLRAPILWPGLLAPALMTTVQGCRRTHFPIFIPQRPMLRRPPSRKQKRAAYNRAHRARMKAGVRTAIVEWDNATVDLLIKAQVLTPREVDSYTRAEIGNAISRLLDISTR